MLRNLNPDKSKHHAPHLEEPCATASRQVMQKDALAKEYKHYEKVFLDILTAEHLKKITLEEQKKSQPDNKQDSVITAAFDRMIDSFKLSEDHRQHAEDHIEFQQRVEFLNCVFLYPQVAAKLCALHLSSDLEDLISLFQRLLKSICVQVNNAIIDLHKFKENESSELFSTWFLSLYHFMTENRFILEKQLHQTKGKYQTLDNLFDVVIADCAARCKVLVNQELSKLLNTTITDELTHIFSPSLISIVKHYLVEDNALSPLSLTNLSKTHQTLLTRNSVFAQEKVIKNIHPNTSSNIITTSNPNRQITQTSEPKKITLLSTFFSEFFVEKRKITRLNAEAQSSENTPSTLDRLASPSRMPA